MNKIIMTFFLKKRVLFLTRHALITRDSDARQMIRTQLHWGDFNVREKAWMYYFHVNGSIGIVPKIEFEIRPNLGCATLKTSRKVVLENPSVCLCLSVRPSVWPSVLLSLFPRALTGVRVNQSSWNFGGMFGYIGHCAVLIFKAIRQPVYKII